MEDFPKIVRQRRIKIKKRVAITKSQVAYPPDGKLSRFQRFIQLLQPDDLLVIMHGKVSRRQQRFPGEIGKKKN